MSSTIAPALAIVRPRVTEAASGESRLLEDVVREIADDVSIGVVRLTGGCGSGKTTALAHLAAVFKHDDRFVFLDQPTAEELRACGDALVVATMLPSSLRDGAELRLAPWRLDEIVEYLLAQHPNACGPVIERLGPHAKRPWVPEVARVVLDRFAESAEATDPAAELMGYVQQQTNARLFPAACRLCLALYVAGSNDLEQAAVEIGKADFPADARSLLRHGIVQLPLATEYLFSRLCSRRSVKYLKRALPAELVETVGRRCRESPTVLRKLNGLVDSRETDVPAMAASILYAADPTWRPIRRRSTTWHFANAIFARASWRGVDLARADLTRTDLTSADLEEANLERAYAIGARFDGARLSGAEMSRITATGASFTRCMVIRAKLPNANLLRADFTEADLSEAALMMANLRDVTFFSARLAEADLTQACLIGAKLDDADFTFANLRRSDLTSVDLREARLSGACFEGATLISAQMEDVRMPEANLRNAVLKSAHLTGSSMPGADLNGADLTGTGLAEIEWEGADLRGANLQGATFHMGSSRSGLVGSPIACEGSKTGFYTDDYEDMHFKRPEEVRKANLRRADLRGANIKNLDFYLVDLRDAQLDAAQLAHVRQCGAILEDLIA